MSVGDQINFRPLFGEQTVPCEGAVGDIVVLTPLGEEDRDPTPQGKSRVFFCIKASEGERPAVWGLVQFDFIATCEKPVPEPTQSLPVLTRG